MEPYMRIERIEAFACYIPLESPLHLGTYTVEAREYTVVKIYVADGLTGAAVGLSRKAPVDLAVLDLLAPALIGTNAFQLAGCQVALNTATAGMEPFGIIGRARSLMDIAIHDLRAKAINLPLWQLLGGHTRSVEVLLVEGYSMPNELEGGLVERLLARVDQGFRRLKIETGSYAEPSKLIEVLERFRREDSETKIILDGLWRWNTIGEAVRFLRLLRDFNIDWIEDPFPIHLLNCYKGLHRANIMPVGAGDDATHSDYLEALLDGGLDVLRLDATTIGGVTTFGELAARAKRQGMFVSPHFHPQIHQHCAFGWNVVDHVEMIPTDRPFDRTHILIQNDAYSTVKSGLLHPPQEPGAGFQLDDKAVEKWARRRGAVSL
jgi:L-alanine-DL-glutamate epimerase-like enolase superfamily enzyme